jgi:hypothetical protein
MFWGGVGNAGKGGRPLSFRHGRLLILLLPSFTNRPSTSNDSPFVWMAATDQLMDVFAKRALPPLSTRRSFLGSGTQEKCVGCKEVRTPCISYLSRYLDAALIGPLSERI